jgi:hypothetical protein
METLRVKVWLEAKSVKFPIKIVNVFSCVLKIEKCDC